MRRTHVGNIAPHYTRLVFLGDVNGPFPRVQIRCPISRLTNVGPGAFFGGEVRPSRRLVQIPLTLVPLKRICSSLMFGEEFRYKVPNKAVLGRKRQ